MHTDAIVIVDARPLCPIDDIRSLVRGACRAESRLRGCASQRSLGVDHIGDVQLGCVRRLVDQLLTPVHFGHRRRIIKDQVCTVLATIGEVFGNFVTEESGSFINQVFL